jgi:hypothetical protein
LLAGLEAIDWEAGLEAATSRTGIALLAGAGGAAAIAVWATAATPETGPASMEAVRPANRDLAQDPWIARLLAVEVVEPGELPHLLATLKALALQGRLPGGVGMLDRVETIERATKADAAKGCGELERTLADLRKAIAAP